MDQFKQVFKQSLPPEQLARWDAAMVEYDRVIRSNGERQRGAPFTDLQWWEERSFGGTGFRATYQPGHPKSALFRRLLEGKPALPLPPPCSYSYPWYETVTSETPLHGFQVAFENEPAVALTLAEHCRLSEQPDGIGVVQIQQSIWTLLERNGDHAVVTYGEWAAAGYRWELDFVEQDIDQAQGFICCWHDPSKGRVRTRDDLQAEATWHVMKRVNAMRRVVEGLDPELHQGESEGMLRTRRELIQLTLDKRVARGAPAIPDEAEIQRDIEKRFKQYLHPESEVRPSYRIGEDGRLIALVWRLTRINPKT